MITSINKLKNFGCYDEYDNDVAKVPDFNRVNIVYGSNGSGKTTLSNLMYLLSKHCKEKHSVIKEYIETDCELEISSSYGKITHRNAEEKNLDIYVFNSKFINDHVFNGNKANIDSFSSEIKLTNEEISVIENRVASLEKRRQKLHNFQNDCETKLETVWSKYSGEFQTKIKGPRLTNVKPTILDHLEDDINICQEELDNLYLEYDLKNKQPATFLQLEEIKTKAISIGELRLSLDNLPELLATPLIIDGNSLQTRINKLQEKITEKNLSQKVKDLNEWFKTGGRLLHINRDIECCCPLCNTDLKDVIGVLVNEYSAFFNDDVNKLQEVLDANILMCKNFLELDQFNVRETEITSLLQQCTQYSIFPNIERFQNKEDLKNEMQKLLDALHLKKKDQGSTVTVNSDEINLIKEYSLYLKKFADCIAENVNDKVEELNKRSLNDIISDIKSKVKIVTTLLYNTSENSSITRSKKNNALIGKITTKCLTALESEIINLAVKRSEEVAKLDAESKYVNIYLNHLGISHFHIEKSKDKKDDNIIITYSKSGRKKSTLKHSLSEGEKTALAFSYFISKIRVEKLEGAISTINECIIVIDDPISSLDDNRLFQTANLIDSFLFYNSSTNDAPCQLFVFSHNIIFVKYLYNAFKGNNSISEFINEYYLCNTAPKIRKIPASLKNFTNTYLIKLKAIMDYKDGVYEYEEVKNFLPNFIRIVLETFLSFKLALVSDGYDKMPGLSHLINSMIKELNRIDDSIIIGGINKGTVIKRLNHLKKISDHESHGNISRAESYHFISEDELNEFSKYTLQIMKFLDEIHFNKVKGLAS